MKIAICGLSPAQLADAPWSDKTWEIWSLNGGYMENNKNVLPRVDKWFDLHNEKNVDYLIAGNYDCPNHKDYSLYKEWLIENQKKLIISEQYSFLEKTEIFPIKEIIKFFNTDFLRNSISMMIAYAIMKYPDLEEIGVWGQTENQDPAYYDEEGCVQYWLGYAKSKGIKVKTSINSSMLKPINGVIYGYYKTAEEILND